MPIPILAARSSTLHNSSPWTMRLADWKAVARRSWSEASEDNIGLIAAGVAFYGFLAMVPMLGAVVLSYGLLADPQAVVKDMQGLTSVMPADAAKLVGDQLLNVVTTSGTKKGLGVLLSLAIALFGARNGAGSLITALNVAYEEKEKRNFLELNLLALAITAAAVAVAILALVAIAALGHLEELVPDAPTAVLVLGKILVYVGVGLFGAAAAATLYRYAPSRQKARWIWITPGSIFAATCWLLLTLLFGVYVAKFGNYNATYGSLSAVVVLLTWIYLSSYVLLFGAELNSEFEHQTAADTTEGSDKSTGKAGASVGGDVASVSEKDVSVPARPARAIIAALPAASRKVPQPSLPAEFAVARVSSRLVRIASLRRVGMLSSGMATVGLSMLRKRGRVVPGAALIAGAVVSSLIARRRDDRDR